MSKLLKFLITLFLIIAFAAISLSLWLKADSTKNQITLLLENIITEELGVKAKISGLSISLPAIVKAENIAFYDKGEKETINIKNFNINILPSLFSFWEITIWSLSAEELHITTIPDIQLGETSDNNTSMFNPDIAIRNLNVEKIILDQALTKQKDKIIFNLSSYIKFDSSNQILDFTLENQLISPNIDKQNSNLLEVFGSYDIKQNIFQVNSLEYKSDTAQITGELLIDESADKCIGKIQYSTNFIGTLISDDTTSNLNGAIELSGSYKEPHIQTTGDLSLDLPDNEYFKFLPISWSSKMTMINGEVKGDLKITQQDGISFSGTMEYKDKKLQLQNFNGIGESFEANTNLTFNTDNSTLFGETTIKAPTLKTLEKSLPFLTNGAIDLKVTYASPDGKNQHLNTSGKIAGLHTSFGACDLVDINLNTEDLWDLKLSPSKVNVMNLNINDFIIRNILLEAQSKDNAVQLNGSIVAHHQYPININFLAILLSTPEQLNVTINNLSGKLGSSQVQNQENIYFNYGKNSTTPLRKLATLKLNNLLIGQGTLDANAEFSDTNAQAHIDFKDLTTSIIPTVLPQNMRDSLLQGEINLSGTIAKPSLHSDINITNIAKTKSDRKLTLNITTDIKDDKTKIFAAIRDEGKDMAKLQTIIPSKFILSPFSYEIEETKAFSASFTAEENNDLLSIIPMPLGSNLTGNIEGKLDAAGNLQTPTLSGRLNIKDGAYNYKIYGIALKDINGEFLATGNNLFCNQLIIHDEFNNILKASGKLLLIKNKDFTITAQTEKFNLMNTPYLQGEIKGNLSVNGNNNSATSKGKFVLGPMDIKIPEHFQEDIPELNIVELNKNNMIISTIQQESYKINLDMDLTTSNKVYIRGWGVDSQLKGNLRITGNTSRPLINGTLRSVHGRYQEFGKTLQIKQGVLTFDGPISPSPYLNIVGVEQIDNTEIRLILSGSIQNPDISIESTPAMSQEEALSMLLFGEHPQDISAFQAAQLASGINRIAGHGGGFDPLGTGRKILGVDKVSFNPDEKDVKKSTVGVGKYLGDNTYFEVETGQEEGSDKLKIEVQLTPKISVETTAAPAGSASVGVNWRFDY
jgi:hypothetical protein